MSKITLGGQEFDVAPLPYGKLKKAIPLMNSWTGSASPDMMDGLGELFALVLGKTVEEIDAMTINFDEIAKAMPAIGEICGLIQAKTLGEAQA